MEKCSLICFSPTGGTERAARVLCGSLAKVTEITDLCRADFAAPQLGSDSFAVIAVPSYGGRVPAAAAERLKLIQAGGARCVLMCVYGNRAYEDTLAELEDIAAERGFRPAAAVAAIAEHSVVRNIAAGRPDAADEEKLRGFASEILAKLSSADADRKPQIPGNRPYKKGFGGGLEPRQSVRCNHCGLCAEVCPVNAIVRGGMRAAEKRKCIACMHCGACGESADDSVKPLGKCISCMRCVHICPRGARSIGAVKRFFAGRMLKRLCAVRRECELFI